MSELLSRRNIPKRYWEVSIDKIPEDASHLPDIQHYISNYRQFVEKGIGLYLWGNLGRGKTAISCILLKALPPQAKGLFVVASDIAGYFIEKTIFDIEGEKEITFVQRMLEVDVLVIDEVNFESRETFKDSSVEYILRKRLANVQPTIFTSNKSPGQLQKIYPAFASALKEGAYCLQVSGKVDLREGLLGDIESEFHNG